MTGRIIHFAYPDPGYQFMVAGDESNLHFYMIENYISIRCNGFIYLFDITSLEDGKDYDILTAAVLIFHQLIHGDNHPLKDDFRENFNHCFRNHSYVLNNILNMKSEVENLTKVNDILNYLAEPDQEMDDI